jgi:pre-mRNA-splicing factor 38A
MTSSSKPRYDRPDAAGLNDDRGYTGALIRGQNPALLFEKGVRERITESYYWKEQCFGLNAATLCDRAADLKFIGGTTGITGKPTPFLCLAFKLLQLVPEKKIILEYLNFAGDEDEEEGGEERNGDVKTEDDDANAEPTSKPDLNATGRLGSFKYLRCLAAFYIRLAWEPVEIYTTLEPLLTDYRKIKRRLKDAFTLTHVDQFIDDLLSKDRMCATSLWKLPSRANLEDLDMLEPRESPLGDEVEALDEVDVEVKSQGSGSYGSRSRSRNSDGQSRSRSRSRSYDSRDRRTRSQSERGRGRRDSRTRSRSWSRTRSGTRSEGQVHSDNGK